MMMFVKTIERFSWDNPYSLFSLAMGICFLALMGFTVFVERRSATAERDWVYFRHITVRNHLWVVYLIVVFLFLIIAL